MPNVIVPAAASGLSEIIARLVAAEKADLEAQEAFDAAKEAAECEMPAPPRKPDAFLVTGKLEREEADRAWVESHNNAVRARRVVWTAHRVDALRKAAEAATAAFNVAYDDLLAYPVQSLSEAVQKAAHVMMTSPEALALAGDIMRLAEGEEGKLTKKGGVYLSHGFSH